VNDDDKIGAKALKLELAAHGKLEEAKWTAKRGKPVLRDVMEGDVSAPAPLGSDPLEAAERLQLMLYKNAHLCDCGLHDLKGEAKINHLLIHDRQTAPKKRVMIQAMVEAGQGPMKASMNGRDWRIVLASEHIYRECTPAEQELQLTLSMMSDSGVYKPQEEYCMRGVVAYSLHALWYAVQKEALFGTGSGGEKLPTSTKVARVTLAAVFGRYYKALWWTNVVTYRLEELRSGSTEREIGGEIRGDKAPHQHLHHAEQA
jgi:hypothetical protein